MGLVGAMTMSLIRAGYSRVYSNSHFLSHIARDTGAHAEPVQHYKLTCLNHLIDVAAYAPPEIRLIGPTSDPQPRIQ